MIKIDWDNLEEVKRYRERLLRALEHSDYISPVNSYQKALHKCNLAIRLLEAGAAVFMEQTVDQTR